jgi:hypothetical protein
MAITTISTVTHLHDEIDIVLRLFAIEQRHDILVMQFCEFLEDLDLLAQQVLRLGQALLRDALDGDGIMFLRMEKEKIMSVCNNAAIDCRSRELVY